MNWQQFRDSVFNDAALDEEAVIACIDALEAMGSGAEVALAACGLPTERLRDQLIRQAIRHRVRFTRDDLRSLSGKVRSDVFTDLVISQGLDPQDWQIDEDNLTWEVFDEAFVRWNRDDLLRRIGKLRTIGSSGEVSSAVWLMKDPACREALYQKALSLGVTFTHHNLKSMGKIPPDAESPEMQTFTEAIHRLTREVDHLCDRIEAEAAERRPERRRKGRGFLRSLLAFATGFAGGAAGKHIARRCDGDCAHCPAHYGYRYGRWYYGHGHQRGCERGGNGGATRRMLRN